jgi:hypothetical protein
MAELRRLLSIRRILEALARREVHPDEQQAILKESRSTANKRGKPNIAELRTALENRPGLSDSADDIIDESCGEKTLGLRMSAHKSRLRKSRRVWLKSMPKSPG